MKHICGLVTTVLLSLCHGAALTTEGHRNLDTGGVQDVVISVLGGAGCLVFCPTFCVALSSAILSQGPGREDY